MCCVFFCFGLIEKSGVDVRDEATLRDKALFDGVSQVRGVRSSLAMHEAPKMKCCFCCTRDRPWEGGRDRTAFFFCVLLLLVC